MEFKCILRIAAEIDSTGAIGRRVARIAAVVRLVMPDVIVAEIMEYRGIEKDDLYLIRVSRDYFVLGGRCEYMRYIVQRDISDHIIYLFGIYEERWLDVMAEHKYALTDEVVAIVAANENMLIRVIYGYFAFCGTAALTLRNVYMLIAAIPPDRLPYHCSYIIENATDTALRRLIALARWSRKFHGSVPTLVQICLDAHIGIDGYVGGGDGDGDGDGDEDGDSGSEYDYECEFEGYIEHGGE